MLKFVIAAIVGLGFAYHFHAEVDAFVNAPTTVRATREAKTLASKAERKARAAVVAAVEAR